MGKMVTVNKCFKCPYCSNDAALFLNKLKVYLSFWSKFKCISCGRTLTPNMVTRKFIWFCCFSGFFLDLLFSWLFPLDKVFDFLIVFCASIPFLLNFSLFQTESGQVNQ